MRACRERGAAAALAAFAALLAGTAVAPPPAAAGARLGLGLVAEPPSPLASAPASDLVRYAAYRTTGGQLVIRDTLTGRSRRAPLGRTCYPAAVGAGQVLVDCFSELPDVLPLKRIGDALAVDVTTGRGRRFYSNPDGTANPALAIGRYWARTGCLEGDCVAFYFNLRTQAVRRLTDLPLRDLDSPMLARRRPRPLGFPRLQARGNLEYLRLDRDRRVLLDRCPRGCSYFQLSGGLVTWTSTQQAVRALRVSDLRRYRWAFDGTGLYALHTRSEILVMSGKVGVGNRLYAIKAP